MNHFSSMPVGTGPYAVVRNNQNQLKIHAFEDYFGYRALIDEVNVWVPHHGIGAGADRHGGKVVHGLPLLRQHHRRHLPQQPGQPAVGLAQMNIQGPGGGRFDAFDM